MEGVKLYPTQTPKLRAHKPAKLGTLTLNTINDYKPAPLGCGGDESTDLYPP
ncbi:MAG: hypothetical protein WBV70_02810 [Candidatus Bathyarchaeia archaeon]